MELILKELGFVGKNYENMSHVLNLLDDDEYFKSYLLDNIDNFKSPLDIYQSFRLELIKNKRCTKEQFEKYLEKGWEIIAYESVMFCKMNRLAEKKFKKIVNSDLTNDDFYVKLVENSFEYSPLLCLKKIEQEVA